MRRAVTVALLGLHTTCWCGYGFSAHNRWVLWHSSCPVRKASESDTSVPGMQPEVAFGEVIDECGTTAELFSKLPPIIADATSRSAVTVGAIMSLWLTPGTPLASGIGAVLGGGLTRFTVAPLLVEGRYRAMQARVAAVLRDSLAAGGWSSSTREQVSAIKESWRIPKEYSTALLCQIYARYFIELMKSADVMLLEVKNLGLLGDILGLNSEARGNAHYDVAVEVYRGMQWASGTQLEDQNSEEYKLVSKLLFVTDRVLSSDPGTSDEVRKYEAGRVRSVFGLPAVEALDRSLKIAADFYLRALDGAIKEIDDVDAKMLQATRLRLGLSQDFIDEAHRICFSSSIATILDDLQDCRHLKDNMEFLQKVGSLLSFDTAQVDAIIMNHTFPVFQQLMRAAVDSALQSKQYVYEAEQVVNHEEALRVAPDVAMDELQSALEARLASRYRDLLDCSHTHQDDAVTRFRGLLELSNASQSLWNSVLELQPSDLGRTWMVDNYLHGLPVDTQNDLHHRVYEFALISLSRDGALSLDSQRELATLQSLLRMRDADVSRVVKSTMGPRLEHQISLVATGSLQTTHLRDWLDANKIPQDIYCQCALGYYEDRRRSLANEFAILPEEGKQELDALQAMLNLTSEDTQPILHKSALPLYIKSVEEAMSTSGGGIIIEEYQDGLEKLRLRLGMSPENARDAFVHAATRFLRPTIDKILLAFEADFGDTSLTGVSDDNSSGGAETGVLGIASSDQDPILTEVANLVEFLCGNELISGSSTGQSWTYSMNLTNAIPESKVRHAVFRAAVIAQMRSIKPHERAKNLQWNMTTYHFARLLSIPADHIAAIKADVGTRLITRFLMKVFASRTVPDHRDLTFIESVAEQAAFDAPKVVFAAKKEYIALKLRGTQRADWDASSVGAIRATAATMGVDFPGELVLSMDERRDLFKCEASAVIFADEGTGIDSNLAELAEVYGVQEVVEEELPKLCSRLAHECLYSARSNLKTGDSLRVCTALDKLLAVSTVSHDLELEATLPTAEAQNLVQVFSKQCSKKFDVEHTNKRVGELRHLLTR